MFVRFLFNEEKNVITDIDDRVKEGKEMRVYIPPAKKVFDHLLNSTALQFLTCSEIRDAVEKYINDNAVSSYMTRDIIRILATNIHGENYTAMQIQELSNILRHYKQQVLEIYKQYSDNNSWKKKADK